MAQPTVLVVDDEPAIRDMLRLALEMADYHCLEAEDIRAAHCLIVDERPDLVLLDWMLPGGSGLELLRRLKRDDTTRDIPVIMLTARTAEDNVVQGLDVGADDYITKPFAPRELLARLKALLRRSPTGQGESGLQCAELHMDVDSHRVSIAGDVLSIGPTEFKLLQFFMTHADRAYSRAQLLDMVWGANVYIEERTVDVHIRRLRLALKTDTFDYRETVQTVRGMGYLFSVKDLGQHRTAALRARPVTSRQGWWKEVRKVTALLLLAALAGWMIGYPLEVLVIVLLGLLLYWLLQLWRIHQWLSSPDTEPPESVGLWGDIFDKIYTLQRQNLEAHSRLQSTVDYLRDSLASMRDGVVMLDKSGSIEWSNVAALDLLGLRYPQDKGQGILNLVRAPEFHQYFLAEDFNAPLLVETHGQPVLYLRIEVTCFGDGDRLIFVRDVTNIHRLEQMRRDFVGNVSHELRTPLTVISGYLGTLLDADSEPLNPKFRKPLQQMEQQAQRMESLLKDLLWLSRLESLERGESGEKINVAALLKSLLAELEESHPDRVIELTIETPHQLVGDHRELYSAVSNLALNALKYSPQDAPVRISWRQEGEEYQLSVADQGVGIDAAHIPRLTERFYRVDDSRSSATGGTGLGLAIVKHVAAGHNAELRIESVMGVGSKFILVFSA